MMTFGKYKNQPIETVAADRDYTKWLLGQDWFVQKFPMLHHQLAEAASAGTIPA
jgi:hypothetical protein